MIWAMSNISRGGSLTSRPFVPTPPRRRAMGFTLNELLVVIGIIAVLAAIILPAISKARATARQVQCLSQVRQLSQGYVAYLTESDQRGLGFAFTPQTSWVTVLRSRLRMPEQIYLCPEARDASSDFGTASMAWTLTLAPTSGPVQISGSYGFNGWLLTWDQQNKGGDRFSGGTPSEHLPGLLASGATNVPVFADCTWNDAWPRSDDPTPPDLNSGDRSHQGPQLAPQENMMARFAIARHGRSINVAFLDGHAEAVALDQLKQLKWHEQFVYQDWQPPLPDR